MIEKNASTSSNIHELIAKRWSPRSFDPDKPVTRDDLLALLEAARWAPSCFNDQPWRFIVCDKSCDDTSWQKAFALLAEKNQLWAKNAPVLMLAVATSKFNHNGSPSRWGMYDTGAASMALCLQAVALGLAVHQMGGYDHVKAREVFGIPDDCTPMAMMAVGYQADADWLADDFKASETGPRSRADMAERFYVGSWGAGIGQPLGPGSNGMD